MLTRGEAADQLATLRDAHTSASAALELSSKVKKEKLDRAYLDALGELQEKYRDAANLDLLVPVKEEAERFSKNTWIHASNKAVGHAPLLQLQNTYVASYTKLRAEVKVKRLELLRGYGVKLTGLKDTLTKANQIDEAVAVEQERKKIAAAFTRLSKGDAPKVTSPAVLGEDEIDLPVNKQWPYRTEIKRGETIHIKASGYWRVLRKGKKRGPGDKTFYLAARVDGGDMFRIGNDYKLEVEKDGILELTMWEGGKYSNNSGKIIVELKRD